MTSPRSLRARGRGTAAFAAAIAGLGTLGVGVHAWRGGTPSVGWSELVLGLIAVGVTAGFASGRFGDALFS
jgi:hypothetical protein